MRIKLGGRMAGPDGNHAPGEIIDVTETAARRLVDAKFAEYVDQPEIIETTVIGPMEVTATAGKRKGRGARKRT